MIILSLSKEVATLGVRIVVCNNFVFFFDFADPLPLMKCSFKKKKKQAKKKKYEKQIDMHRRRIPSVEARYEATGKRNQCFCSYPFCTGGHLWLNGLHSAT